MNLSLRRFTYLVFHLPGVRAWGKLAYRLVAAAFTALARRSKDVDEVWVLGSGATADVVPALSDLDFLIVLSGGRSSSLERKWLKRFGWLFFFYPRRSLPHHLFFLSAEEWKTLHPIFTQRGSTRGRALFQRRRWQRLPHPSAASFTSDFALKDRLYRALDLFHLFQVPLRQDFGRQGWRSTFLARVRDRLAWLVSSAKNSDRQWTARFLFRVNTLAEQMAAAELSPGSEVFDPELTRSLPSLPPEVNFVNKEVILFSRRDDVDHWIVSPLTESDFEDVMNVYRTTRRRVYLHSPRAYRALHQNYPFVPLYFRDGIKDRVVKLPTWEDPDRIAIEVLRVALAGIKKKKNHYEPAWTLQDVGRGWQIEGQISQTPAPPLSSLIRPEYKSA